MRGTAARPGRTAVRRGGLGPGCAGELELVVLLGPALLLFIGFVLLPIVLAA